MNGELNIVHSSRLSSEHPPSRALSVAHDEPATDRGHSCGYGYVCVRSNPPTPPPTHTMSAVAMNTVAFAPLAAVRSTKRVAQKAAAPVRVAAGTPFSPQSLTPPAERSSASAGGRRPSPFAQGVGRVEDAAGDHDRGDETVWACAGPLRVWEGHARGRSDHQGSGSGRRSVGLDGAGDAAHTPTTVWHGMRGCVHARQTSPSPARPPKGFG